MNKSTAGPMRILQVEDNPDDVLLTRLAFEETHLLEPVRIDVVEDGEEALKFLKKEGKYRNVLRPHLIFLDLNLPKVSGLEVLEYIKQDSHLKDIPVVVFTTSTYEEDVLKSYRAHANCCITKPVDVYAFMEVVKVLQQFWFSVVKLPPVE